MNFALNVSWLVLALVLFLFGRIQIETFIIFVVLMRICMAIEDKEFCVINIKEVSKEGIKCK